MSEYLCVEVHSQNNSAGRKLGRLQLVRIRRLNQPDRKRNVLFFLKVLERLMANLALEAEVNQ